MKPPAVPASPSETSTVVAETVKPSSVVASVVPASWEETPAYETSGTYASMMLNRSLALMETPERPPRMERPPESSEPASPPETTRPPKPPA